MNQISQSSTIPAQNVASGLTWKLSELASIKPNGLKVFSCFSCGGGSSMGYRLAGYDLVGNCEIDQAVATLYAKNLSPKQSFRMSIQEFNKYEHPDLHGIDVLDGSPPCSTFSISGNREKDWGREKMFREGQAKQVLDDLFFHFIETANRLRPKVVVAENVKGLIQGNAKGYVKMIFEAFSRAGYDTQLFLLNSSRMGVPQRRERVFFIARRRDLNLPKVDLLFNEAEIPLRVALEGCRPDANQKPLSEKALDLWKRTKPGDSFAKLDPFFKQKGWGNYFNWKKAHPEKPANTIVSASARFQLHWSEPRPFSSHELVRVQTFPEDYDFGQEPVDFVLGMSVPPRMMQRIAERIAKSMLCVKPTP